MTITINTRHRIRISLHMLHMKLFLTRIPNSTQTARRQATRTPYRHRFQQGRTSTSHTLLPSTIINRRHLMFISTTQRILTRNIRRIRRQTLTPHIRTLWILTLIPQTLTMPQRLIQRITMSTTKTMMNHIRPHTQSHLMTIRRLLTLTRHVRRRHRHTRIRTIKTRPRRIIRSPHSLIRRHTSPLHPFQHLSTRRLLSNARMNILITRRQSMIRPIRMTSQLIRKLKLNRLLNAPIRRTSIQINASSNLTIRLRRRARSTINHQVLQPRIRHMDLSLNRHLPTLTHFLLNTTLRVTQILTRSTQRRRTQFSQRQFMRRTSLLKIMTSLSITSRQRVLTRQVTSRTMINRSPTRIQIALMSSTRRIRNLTLRPIHAQPSQNRQQSRQRLIIEHRTTRPRTTIIHSQRRVSSTNRTTHVTNRTSLTVTRATQTHALSTAQRTTITNHITTLPLKRTMENMVSTTSISRLLRTRLTLITRNTHSLRRINKHSFSHRLTTTLTRNHSTIARTHISPLHRFQNIFTRTNHHSTNSHINPASLLLRLRSPMSRHLNNQQATQRMSISQSSTITTTRSKVQMIMMTTTIHTQTRQSSPLQIKRLIMSLTRHQNRLISRHTHSSRRIKLTQTQTRSSTRTIRIRTHNTNIRRLSHTTNRTRNRQPRQTNTHPISRHISQDHSRATLRRQIIDLQPRSIISAPSQSQVIRGLDCSRSDTPFFRS